MGDVGCCFGVGGAGFYLRDDAGVGVGVEVEVVIFVVERGVGVEVQIKWWRRHSWRCTGRPVFWIVNKLGLVLLLSHVMEV